jgi:hypothetical protein
MLAVVTQPLSLAFSLTRLPLMHDFMQMKWFALVVNGTLLCAAPNARPSETSKRALLVAHALAVCNANLVGFRFESCCALVH